MFFFFNLNIKKLTKVFLVVLTTQISSYEKASITTYFYNLEGQIVCFTGAHYELEPNFYMVNNVTIAVKNFKPYRFVFFFNVIAMGKDITLFYKLRPVKYNFKAFLVLTKNMP